MPNSLSLGIVLHLILFLILGFVKWKQPDYLDEHIGPVFINFEEFVLAEEKSEIEEVIPEEVVLVEEEPEIEEVIPEELNENDIEVLEEAAVVQEKL